MSREDEPTPPPASSLANDPKPSSDAGHGLTDAVPEKDPDHLRKGLDSPGESR